VLAGATIGVGSDEAVPRHEPDLLGECQPVEIDTLREGQHLHEHVNQ